MAELYIVRYKLANSIDFCNLYRNLYWGRKQNF